ncbi:pentapeptide repeat-containing protein [cyanobacterium endosymbiont of Rhopalodia gibberula]
MGVDFCGCDLRGASLVETTLQ